MRTKLIRILMVVAIALSPLAVSGATAAEQLPYVTVSVGSGYVGDYEDYTIEFLLNRTVTAGETITVTFDDAVMWPHFREFRAADITLDGGEVGATARWSSNHLTVTAGSSLTAGAVHTLVIARSAMIKNPSMPSHLQLTLRDDTTGLTYTSNYYTITDVTRIAPLSLTVDDTSFTGTTIILTFRTGKNGALTGAVSTGMPGSSTSDAISVRLSHELSVLWDQAGGAVTRWMTPTMLSDRKLALVSSVRWNEGDDTYRKQLTYAFDTSIAADTEVAIRFKLAKAAAAELLTTAEYIDLWTTKELTMVRITMSGVPEPAGTGTTPPAAEDTAAPVVTWTADVHPWLPRLVTIHIVVTDEHLEEAWFVGGTHSLVHTRLSSGDNNIIVVNRSGIHGTITARDKAGNITTVPVDLSPPAGI